MTKRNLCAALAALVLCGLVACGGPVESEGMAVPSSAPASQPAPQPESAPPQAEPLEWPDGDGGPVENDGTLAGLLGAFAANTAGQLVDSAGNSCYSPASLYLALALTTAGAGGETQEQMLDLLGAGDAGTLHALMGQAMEVLPFDGLEELLADYEEGWLDLPEGLDETELAELMPEAGGRLELANSVWLNSLKYNGFLPQFEQTATRDYSARLQALPFGQPATDQALNQWITDNTGGRVAAGYQTDPDLAMLLVNTVYYLDRWVAVFREAENTTEPFTLADGGEADREYMHKTLEDHHYYTGKGFSASTLYLKHGSMTFVLPDEGVTPAELLATPGRVAALLQRADEKPAKVIFQVPKFTFESELRPKRALMEMGYALPFTYPAADFTGIAAAADPGARPYIDDIIQKTYIRVDEEGAEAAAMTMVAMADGIAEVEPTVVELRLTRPFIFILSRAMQADNEYLGEVPLFVGVVNDPVFE